MLAESDQAPVEVVCERAVILRREVWMRPVRASTIARPADRFGLAGFVWALGSGIGLV
ncbi:hypothetical protein [Subtercola vilae]|uniref:hypothetical protein n=1 Tax=Subtercola vilae TaxID=2056433 RepID=UPI001375C835|nr:hypothetical protein [Subtercola vilae]